MSLLNLIFTVIKINEIFILLKVIFIGYFKIEYKSPKYKKTDTYT